MSDEQAQAVSKRDQMRSALLGKRHTPKTKNLTLFGVEVELRQPSLQSILAAKDQSNDEAALDMIVRYCYVPGTDERVFEPSDKGTIAQWPFGDDVLRLQTAIAELTGVDITQEVAEVRTDPLSEQSSDTQ